LRIASSVTLPAINAGRYGSIQGRAQADGFHLVDAGRAAHVLGMIDRRQLLGLGTAAAIAPLALGAADASSPQIRRHVRLGRTGLMVSDIGFGSASSSDPELVRQALDRGVTYFDTAESYRFGWAEEALGEGLKGARDRVVLSSKTKAGAGDTRTEMMAALEGSLKRLRTDYLDIYFNHAVNDPARVQNPEWWEFTERARQQGKIRFRGMSGHGSRLVESLDYAVEHDLVDVVLVAYSFAQDPDFLDRLPHTFHYVALQPELPGALERAKAKDIGVIAMKTLMGGRLNDMRAYERDGATFAQTALRWVLSSPRVDAALISMTSAERIDEYVGASGDPEVREGDLGLLGRYAGLQSGRWCRPGCNACEGVCPEGVAIAEVLRTRMYAVDYRDPALALEDYAKLGQGAAACLGCAHQACLGACPYGLPIPELTRDAASRLG
jgi:predicted aldo/keto reductase-like oxidoreductase